MKRTDSAAKSLANLLDQPDSQLKALIDRLAQLEGMDHTLASSLPASLRGKVRVANVTSDTLELMCGDAATATRLRYIAPEVLTHFTDNGYPQLRQIHVAVQQHR
jgi:hypothetical protein